VHGPGCGHDHHDHAHHDHDHHHHDEVSPIHDITVTSVSLRGGEMQADKFFSFIDQVTQEQGPNILRLKGIIAFKDDPERYVVQGVHMIVEGDHQRAWKDGEERESRLVFIGRNLDRDGLNDAFLATAA
jgi:G3E family GTPase